MKQNLKGVSETLLIPLWARAVETKRIDPIIKDERALEMMEQIEYDFSKFEGRRMPQVSIAIRTELLDKATRDFMESHADGFVINIGCGLDTRFSRLDNGKIHWYDLDLPEPIRIRKRFFTETDRYKMIARSVFDYNWIQEIKLVEPAGVFEQVGTVKPLLIIAEGLFMYFKENEVKDVLNKLVEAFPGAEMLIEVTTPAVVKRNREHDTKFQRNAPFQWGIKSGKKIEKLNPKIEFITEWNYFDYHKARRKEANLTLKREYSSRIIYLKFDENLF